MLQIKEVDSKEQFATLKLKASPNIDYLYLLKYENKLVMLDNGQEIPICCNFLSEDDIQGEISDIINILNKEE